MTRRDLLVWVGLLVATTVGLVAWVVLARPSQADIAQATQTLPPLSITNLTDQTFSDLTSRDNNGTVPVQPAPTNSPRNDPFQ